MGQFFCTMSQQLEDPEESSLTEFEINLRKMPKEVLVKILLLVENNFEVFYVNVFRVYPCFARFMEMIETPMRKRRNVRILNLLHNMSDEKCAYIGSELRICGKFDWERPTLRMNEYRADVIRNTESKTSGKAFFYQNDADGVLMLQVNMNEIYGYEMGTSRRIITTPASEKCYVITGVFMNDRGFVSLNFI